MSDQLPMPHALPALPMLPPSGALPAHPPGGALPPFPPGGALSALPAFPPSGALPALPPGGALPALPPGGALPALPAQPQPFVATAMAQPTAPIAMPVAGVAAVRPPLGPVLVPDQTPPSVAPKPNVPKAEVDLALVQVRVLIGLATGQPIYSRAVHTTPTAHSGPHHRRAVAARVAAALAKFGKYYAEFQTCQEALDAAAQAAADECGRSFRVIELVNLMADNATQTHTPSASSNYLVDLIVEYNVRMYFLIGEFSENIAIARDTKFNNSPMFGAHPLAAAYLATINEYIRTGPFPELGLRYRLWETLETGLASPAATAHGATHHVMKLLLVLQIAQVVEFDRGMLAAFGIPNAEFKRIAPLTRGVTSALDQIQTALEIRCADDIRTACPKFVLCGTAVQTNDI